MKTVYIGFFDDGPRLFSTRERAEFYSPERILEMRMTERESLRAKASPRVLESQATEEHYRHIEVTERCYDRLRDALFERILCRHASLKGRTQ
jgi:hypothetical protein